MTTSIHFCRNARNWLIVPVLGLFWASQAHGGLAIGLVDAHAEDIHRGTVATCLPESDDDQETSVENANGQMHGSPLFQSNQIEQLALFNPGTSFESDGSRVGWKSSRVTSVYVRPPPLIVPIAPIKFAF